MGLRTKNQEHDHTPEGSARPVSPHPPLALMPSLLSAASTPAAWHTRWRSLRREAGGVCRPCGRWTAFHPPAHARPCSGRQVLVRREAVRVPRRSLPQAVPGPPVGLGHPGPQAAERGGSVRCDQVGSAGDAPHGGGCRRRGGGRGPDAAWSGWAWSSACGAPVTARRTGRARQRGRPTAGPVVPGVVGWSPRPRQRQRVQRGGRVLVPGPGPARPPWRAHRAGSPTSYGVAAG